MALTHAPAATVIYAGALGTALADARTETLVNEAGMQVFRLVLGAGKTLATHSVPERLLIQCLEGELVFEARGLQLRLKPGELCHLLPDEPHAVTAVSACSALVTLVGQRPGTHTTSSPHSPAHQEPAP